VGAADATTLKTVRTGRPSPASPVNTAAAQRRPTHRGRKARLGRSIGHRLRSRPLPPRRRHMNQRVNGRRWPLSAMHRQSAPRPRRRARTALLPRLPRRRLCQAPAPTTNTSCGHRLPAMCLAPDRTIGSASGTNLPPAAC
jgi:hypothetical protein